MPSTPPPREISAVLAAVGGTPAPILHVLRQHRAPHVWYFCSEGSRATADEIQTQLDWHPQARFIEVERYEELGPCYRELRHKIPHILAESRVNPDTVLVDYTGGTKTMSAALVLAGVEFFQQFNYVGGVQRAKGGLGVVVDGKERVLYHNNPWSDLAIREVERARDLWAAGDFEAAARTLHDVAPRVPGQVRFSRLADLCAALAARHRLDFNRAQTGLGKLIREFATAFDAEEDYGLKEFVRASMRVCEACAKDAASESFLRELLDNALRTAQQRRFEDAAARLYRAMEMQGQLWLTQATNEAFQEGCLQEGCPLPPALRRLPFCSPDHTGRIKLALEQIFLALAALGHPRGQIVANDLAQTDISGRTKSRWRAATQQRNRSILAHGVHPIGSEGFDQMKSLASEFLGFDLERQTNPIPPLDLRWFEKTLVL